MIHESIPPQKCSISHSTMTSLLSSVIGYHMVSLSSLGPSLMASLAYCAIIGYDWISLGQGSIWLSVTNMNSQPIQLLSLFDPTQPLGKSYAGPAAPFSDCILFAAHTHTHTHAHTHTHSYTHTHVCLQISVYSCIYLYRLQVYIYNYKNIYMH